MDDSFFPAELMNEFDLADAEYTFDNGNEIDTAVCSESDSTESEIADVEDEGEVNISLREEDETEKREIDEFISKGCSCSLGSGGSSCSTSFSRDDISNTRMSCKEMSTVELDMLVLANLDAHRSDGDVTTANNHAGRSLSGKAGTKRRANIDYYFRGKRVCKGTYTFVHAIGPK